MRSAKPLVTVGLLVLGLSGSLWGGEPDPKFTAFAQQLVAKLKQGDPAALEKDIDQAGFAERCFKGLDLPPKARERIEKDPVLLAKASGLCGAAGQGLKLTLLGVRETGGEVRARIRLHAGMARNYSDALLVAGADGTVKLQDILVYGKGDWVSGEQRFSLRLQAEARKAGAGAASDAAKAIQVRNAYLTGPFPAAHAGYQALPAALQNEPSMLIARLIAATRVWDEKDKPTDAETKEYGDAAAAYAKACPDTPSANLFLASFYNQTGKPEEALRYIAKASEQLGGDASFKVSRAHALRQMDKAGDAKKELAAAIQQEPALDSAYPRLIELQVETGDLAGALKTVQAADPLKAIDVDELMKTEGYDELVKSPAFQAWLKARKK